MEKLTFTAGENLVLVDGEIMILKSPVESKVDDHVSERILASTKQMPNTVKLDRSRFVKPVDLDELTEKHQPEINKGTYYWSVFDKAFKEGYNANKAEFTKQDMIDAMNHAIEFSRKETGFIYFESYRDNYINNLRPLTLPKQIITDQEYNVIEVLW